MNKTIFTAMMLSVCLLAVGAGGNTNPFRMGITAGLNISDGDYRLTPQGQTVEYSRSTNPLAGLRAGLTADASLSRHFSVNSGLLYSRKGLKINKAIGDEDPQRTYEKWRLDYLEVPLNLNYGWQLSGIKIFMQTGPYLGIALGARLKEPGGGKARIEIGDESAEDITLRRTDLGLNVAAGVEKGKLGFTLNYGSGFTNINNYKLNKEKLYNRVWSLSVTCFLW